MEARRKRPAPRDGNPVSDVAYSALGCDFNDAQQSRGLRLARLHHVGEA